MGDPRFRWEIPWGFLFSDLKWMFCSWMFFNLFMGFLLMDLFHGYFMVFFMDFELVCLDLQSGN